jgi:sugar O-acyltransferase (sialic acid O-acetyltransferase NeuD family)
MVGIDGDLIDTILSEGSDELLGVFDLLIPNQPTNLPHLGTDDKWIAWSETHPDVHALLSVDLPRQRSKLLAVFGEEKIGGFVSRSAHVSRGAQLGVGALVQRSVDISHGVKVGRFAKIAIGVSIHHDCVIGDFVTLAPGCRLLGNATIGDQCFVGAGAIVLPRVRLGDRVTVGAGAVVTDDIPENTTVVGVPARAVTDKSSGP